MSSSIYEMWIERIRENFKRLEKGLQWKYYDKDFNECSKEQCRISFGTDDLEDSLVQQAKEVFN